MSACLVCKSAEHYKGLFFVLIFFFTSSQLYDKYQLCVADILLPGGTENTDEQVNPFAEKHSGARSFTIDGLRLHRVARVCVR